MADVWISKSNVPLDTLCVELSAVMNTGARLVGVALTTESVNDWLVTPPSPSSATTVTECSAMSPAVGVQVTKPVAGLIVSPDGAEANEYVSVWPLGSEAIAAYW